MKIALRVMNRAFKLLIFISDLQFHSLRICYCFIKLTNEWFRLIKSRYIFLITALISILITVLINYSQVPFNVRYMIPDIVLRIQIY